MKETTKKLPNLADLMVSSFPVDTYSYHYLSMGHGIINNYSTSACFKCIFQQVHLSSHIQQARVEYLLNIKKQSRNNA